MLTRKIIAIKADISSNNYELGILKNEIDILRVNRNNYLSKLEKIVIEGYYTHRCFEYYCSNYIDSTEDEFCIVCGWYKCSWCGKCGCDYKPFKKNPNYAEVLRRNGQAKEFKKYIEKVDKYIDNSETWIQRVEFQNKKSYLKIDRIFEKWSRNET